MLTATYAWKKPWESAEEAIQRQPNRKALKARLERGIDEWREVTSNDWGKLCKRYLRKYGERLEFFRVIESTRQGAPHHHVVLNTRQTIDDHWFATTWADITGDSSFEHGVTITRRGGRTRFGTPIDSNRHALAYLLKYIGKGIGGEGSFFKNGRQYHRSNGFPVAEIADAGSMITRVDGAVLVFNRAEYKRVYGRFYHWKKKLERMTKTGNAMTPEDRAKYEKARDEFKSWDALKDGKLLKGQYGKDFNPDGWEDPPVWQPMAQVGTDIWGY